MNKIWTTIIIVAIIFGILNGNSEKMVDELFNVPKNALNFLLNISSILVIYSGLFKIAIDCNVIKKLSKGIIKYVSKIFKVEDLELLELISASIIANLLGLGPANMAIAIQIMEKFVKLKEHRNYNIALYLVINVSSLCILPLSTLAFREKYNSIINISFIPLLFIASFITTIVGIILVKVIKFDE